MHAEVKDTAMFIETRISHEITLMGQRMTWLVTSQAFLFAAWVQLVKAQGSSGATGSGAAACSSAGDSAELLLYLIPAVGLGVSLAGWVAIAAAMRMVDLLVTDRASIDGPLGLRAMSPLRPSPWTRIAGHAPTGVLPPLFVGAWVMVVLVSVGRWTNASILTGTAVAFSGYLVFWLSWTTRRHRQSVVEAKGKEAMAAQDAAASPSASPQHQAGHGISP